MLVRTGSSICSRPRLHPRRPPMCVRRPDRAA
jgi:hypothetical protein